MLAKTATYQKTEKKQLFNTHKQAKDRSAPCRHTRDAGSFREQNATFSPEILHVQTTAQEFLFVAAGTELSQTDRALVKLDPCPDPFYRKKVDSRGALNIKKFQIWQFRQSEKRD
jgi:hypothetical protein